MKISALMPEDRAVVGRALNCVASGRVLQHDFEFETIFGLAPSEVIAVSENYEALDVLDEASWAAIANSMAWLVHYPHGQDNALKEFGLSREEIARTHGRIREVFELPAANSFLDLIQ